MNLCRTPPSLKYVSEAPSLGLRQRYGARPQVYFPVFFCLYFIARIAPTPSLCFLNIKKDKHP